MVRSSSARLPEGTVEEVKTRVLADQLGEKLAAQAGVDFEGPVIDRTPEPEISPARAPRPARAAEKVRPHRAAPEEPRAGTKKPGPRKHVSALRDDRAKAEQGPRRRIEMSATADRNGRAVKVERVSVARRGSEEAPATRNARRFRAEREDREAPAEARAVRAPRGEARDGRARDGKAFVPRGAGGGERKFSRPRGEAGGGEAFGGKTFGGVRGEAREGKAFAPRGEAGGERKFGKPRAAGGEGKFGKPRGETGAAKTFRGKPGGGARPAGAPGGGKPGGGGARPGGKTRRRRKTRGEATRRRKTESLMRIVGGRFKGRALKGPRGEGIRPTSDRLRETLFNILVHSHGDPVAGARVIDLFAGTGALGLEAISRGAAFALLVDDGAQARALICAECRGLGAWRRHENLSPRRAAARRRALRARPMTSPCSIRPMTAGSPNRR